MEVDGCCDLAKAQGFRRMLLALTESATLRWSVASGRPVRNLTMATSPLRLNKKQFQENKKESSVSFLFIDNSLNNKGEKRQNLEPP